MQSIFNGQATPQKLVVMLISEVQFQKFIEGYFGKLSQLTSEFSHENKGKIFPHVLIRPHKIVGIVSNVHGLAIEFVEESNQWSLRILKVDQRIENAVLPQKSTKNIAFAVGRSRNVAIGKMGIYTKEFFEKYIKKVEGTALKLDPPLEGFVEISVGGDVFFHDIQFGAVLDGKPSVKTVVGLQIFGSNSAEDFTLEQAEKRAIEVFNWYLGLAILRMPKFPEPPERILKLKILSEKIEDFQVLMSKPKLSEHELQKFFEKNPDFLSFGTKYRKLFPQILLKRTRDKDLRPDFFLERVTDGFCDILDIKLPRNKILRGKVERRRFTDEVYEAIAQVHEYKEYFNDPRHRKWLKKRYRLSVYIPNIMVLIGLGKNIEKEDLIKMRDRHPSVEVITYNDILKQIMYLKDLLESFGVGFKRR